MKRANQWVVAAGMGMVSVSICVLLVISSEFTNKAMAAGEHLDTIYRIYLPFLTKGLPSATTITSHIPDPSVPGQVVVVGVIVSGAGIPVPTGTVDITGADSNCSILLAGGSGSCGVIFNTTGNKTLTATYRGDADYASSSGSASHIVEKGSTTTIITADTPDPSKPMQAVALSVVLIGGGVTPTGTVAISGADINCSLTLSGGAGSCNVVFNTIGAKILTATYSGDGNYLASLDAEPHTVKNASTTTITSDNADPSTPGETITVCFSVSAAGPVPTGTVAITGADGGPYAAVGLDGFGKGCLYNVIFNTAGAKLLSALYSGDANYVGSSGTASHTVNQGVSKTAIVNVNPEPSHPYQSVTVTVQVNGPGDPPTRSVAISVSGQPSTCSFTLSTPPPFPPEGHCDVVFATTGTFTITATYSGDGNYLGSVNTWVHTVN